MAGKIKWAVIGSGGIARKRTIPEGIVPADNAELVMVYDVNQEVNAAVGKAFDAVAAGSLKQLFNADIDAVYIASPANLHFEQVISAAKAGKHILCEKPLAISTERVEKMLEFCKEAGVMLGTAFMMRFQTQHQAALQMIHQGKLGTLTCGRAQLSGWYPPIAGAWRQNPATGGGGSLMDLGGHCIDLLEMFFGQIKQVNCVINNIVHNYESEDGAIVILLFRNGAIASVDTFFCIPNNSSMNVLELYGSKGSILARGTLGQGDAGEMAAFLNEPQAGCNAQQSRSADRGIKISPELKNTYLAEIEEFSQAVIEEREPSNSAKLGLRSQKVLAACYESAASGKAVEL